MTKIWISACLLKKRAIIWIYLLICTIYILHCKTNTMYELDSLDQCTVVNVARSDHLIAALCVSLFFFFLVEICNSSSSPGVSSDTSEPRARIPSFLTHDSDKYLRRVLFSSLSLFQSRRHRSKFTPGSVLDKWVSRPHGFCPVLATRWVGYQSFFHCTWAHCAFFTIGAWGKFLK